MYVDGLVGVCLRKDLEKELAFVWSIITDLLGDNSVADHMMA